MVCPGSDPDLLNYGRNLCSFPHKSRFYGRKTIQKKTRHDIVPNRVRNQIQHDEIMFRDTLSEGNLDVLSVFVLSMLHTIISTTRLRLTEHCRSANLHYADDFYIAWRGSTQPSLSFFFCSTAGATTAPFPTAAGAAFISASATLACSLNFLYMSLR